LALIRDKTFCGGLADVFEELGKTVEFAGLDMVGMVAIGVLAQANLFCVFSKCGYCRLGEIGKAFGKFGS